MTLNVPSCAAIALRDCPDASVTVTEAEGTGLPSAAVIVPFNVPVFCPNAMNRKSV